MSCDTCDDLDRQIAAARDRRQVATTEAEINAADQQEYDLALQMIDHLGFCSDVKGNLPSTKQN
jgi:hypothetical protein